MRLDRWTAVVFVVFWAAPALAVGQNVTSQPAAVLEVPFFDRTPQFYRVAEVDPQGNARIEIRPEFQQFKLSMLEGHYVMVLRPEAGQGETRLYRAELTEVDSPTTAKAKLSPEAAGKLRKGDVFFLARPGGATTAQMKALPNVIPVGGKPGEAAAPSSILLREAVQRAQSVNNLKQMGLAFHNFHSVNNAFPPAVIYGPDGKPWHSWRVLILPYLEQGPLYNAYDFTQPWDSEKNRKLLDKMPAVYRDPVNGDNMGHFTHYAALVGEWKVGDHMVHTTLPPSGIKMKDARPGSVNFSDPAAHSIRTVTDGTSNTVVVAPVAPDRKIPWTKPEDITVKADFPGLGKPGGIAAPYHTGDKPDAPRAAPVLFLDGSVRIIPDTIKPETLRALATRDGGEVISNDAIPPNTLPMGHAPGQPKVLKIYVEGGKARAAIE